MGLVTLNSIIRASAALPAAGAYDTPLEFSCADADQADFWISYDEHASATNGRVTVKVEVAHSDSSADHWTNEKPVLYTGAEVQGSNVDTHGQNEEIEYDPTVATAEYFRIQCNNLNADKIRISVKESGDTSNPGTVVIYGRFKANNLH